MRGNIHEDEEKVLVWTTKKSKIPVLIRGYSVGTKQVGNSR